jgi:hypothetical protein
MAAIEQCDIPYRVFGCSAGVISAVRCHCCTGPDAPRKHIDESPKANHHILNDAAGSAAAHLRAGRRHGRPIFPAVVS